MTDQPSVPLACPRCGTILALFSPDEARCPADQLVFQRQEGIWRMLLPEREGLFSQFIREYETVRLAEQRRSEDPAYYRSLPGRDLSGRRSPDWRIRAASYSTLVRNILRPRFRLLQRPLVVLDLGAGNGWLSNRLAASGQRVSAVDLVTNDYDGLGCYRFYETAFTPVQAEFDHLPFPDQAADLVIFNASLHYSPDYLHTLHESRRVLAPAGSLVILDTPFYHDPASGRQMVREREALFTRRYGFPSNALHSENYLTYARLQDLGKALHLRWRVHTPYYGLRWLLRPLAMRLRGTREPARFHVIEGSRLL